MSKQKYIEDCARLIEERVKRLEAELELLSGTMTEAAKASDRAAILEAKYLALLIRKLGNGPYTGHPYEVARKRWGRGE